MIIEMTYRAWSPMESGTVSDAVCIDSSRKLQDDSSPMAAVGRRWPVRPLLMTAEAVNGGGPQEGGSSGGSFSLLTAKAGEGGVGIAAAAATASPRACGSGWRGAIRGSIPYKTDFLQYECWSCGERTSTTIKVRFSIKGLAGGGKEDLVGTGQRDIWAVPPGSIHGTDGS